jgi:hypothetical protein
MYTINANRITLTFRYTAEGGVEIRSIDGHNSFFHIPGDLAVGSNDPKKLEIRWGADHETATADLYFEGDFMPADVESALAEFITTGHYRVVFDARPVPTGTLAGVPDECIFPLEEIATGTSLLAVAIASPSSGGRTVRAGEVSRPRPEAFTSASGVKPTTPGAKLVLLPTRKTNMPGSIKKPEQGRRARGRP